ncbi:MAG TPA: hypothetical protein DCS93_18485 [Microscillaceae bacterium]|nr:hypothetical protein [Microscillaceae bacterium]
MGKYSNAEWYIQSKTDYLEKYGDVPPPWVYEPDAHPFSIGWRMGGGESHIMVLGEWLEEKAFSFDEKLAYVKKYPAPARWYYWIVGFLWDIEAYDLPDAEIDAYFKKLEQLGFEDVANVEEDLDRDDLI